MEKQLKTSQEPPTILHKAKPLTLLLQEENIEPYKNICAMNILQHEH